MTEPFLILHLLIKYHLLSKASGASADRVALEWFVALRHTKLRALTDQFGPIDRDGKGWLSNVFDVVGKRLALKEIIPYRRRGAKSKATSKARADNGPPAPFAMFAEIPDLVLKVAKDEKSVRLIETLDEIQEILEALDTFVGDPPRRVPLKELGPFLKLLRGEVPLSPEVLKNPPIDFEQLEQGHLNDSLSVEKLQPILNAYGAQPIFVEWMAAKPLDDVVHIKTFTPGTKLGVGCTYKFPELRLGNVDIAFVEVELTPAAKAETNYVKHPRTIDGLPQSDRHSHPGDELIWVRKGTVEVHLDNSGQRERLEKGDYVHFQAAQEHVIFNVGTEQATVWVIRFYQVRKQGTHAALAKLMQDALLRYPLVDWDRRILTLWLRQITRLSSGGPSSDADIVDLFSFARRLKLFCRHREGDPDFWDDEAHFWKRLREDSATAEITNLFEVGTPRLDGRAIVDKVCKILKIPRVLMDDCFVPSYLRGVVVRDDEWQKPPEFADDSAKNASYKIPSRSLIGSDIAINKLRLDPDPKNGSQGNSPRNDHPGSELVICLKGSAKLKYGKRRDVKFEEGEWVHYLSKTPHQVVNCSPQQGAELLVIRFYDSFSDQEA